MTTHHRGPLDGIRILEIGGIGPTPFAGMMLADMGADVIRIDRAGQQAHSILNRSRRSIVVDLKRREGIDLVKRLARHSDAALEGYRPGVAERLGVGPQDLQAVNTALVYGRMTGWGQKGPLAAVPGHDINYLAASGALHAIGSAGGDPVVPLNLIGDFGGGGMLLAYGVLCGVLHARASGRGQVIDAAMIDGIALLMAMTFGYLNTARWQDTRGVNRLDGGAPWYRVYRCADAKHVAVGCVEPQFFSEFVRVLHLDGDPEFVDQNDSTHWPAMHRRLELLFASRTRDEWVAAFEGSAACVTPVLSMAEAAEYPHNHARATYVRDAERTIAPMPAPRFNITPAPPPRAAPDLGAHTREILGEAGIDERMIDDLYQQRIVG
jgi:alpha-methylacyl-CoA racemase